MFETSLDRVKVSEMIRRFNVTYNKIMFSYDTCEVAIKNWLKSTNIESEQIKAMVKEDLIRVKDKSLISYIKI